MGCTGAAQRVQSQDIRKLGGRMTCTGAAPKKIWTYIFEGAGRMVGCAAPVLHRPKSGHIFLRVQVGW